MPALPGLSLDDLVVRRLAGPPETGFDCGREEQTAFLYERAWEDQQALLSVTYLYHLNGILAAYATICMDAITLSRRERGVAVRYQEVDQRARDAVLHQRDPEKIAVSMRFDLREG